MGWKRLKQVARGALRIVGYEVAFAVVGLIITPMLINTSAMLRIPFAGLFVVLAVWLLFMEGSYRGEMDTAKGEALHKLTQQRSYTATDEELSMRFWPMKGIASALLAALPFTLIALYVAITAVPYVYALQDLPGWLANYFQRAEVGDALLYTRDVQLVTNATDYLRVATRFMLFPYIGLVGTMSDEASLLFDRVSPLLTLVLPIAAAIGYQFGPQRRAKAVKLIEMAKNKPRKRLKKTAKRSDAPKEKKQLI